MDIFDKCFNYKEPKFIKQMGIYPYFKAIGESDGSVVKVKGKEIIMTGSNNYLGLTHDKRVIEAATKATKKYGTGCTGSRFLNGNLELHEEIESALAKFLNKEASLVFSTGFTANQGTIEAICGKEDVIFSDVENHASIISGCSISKAKILKFNHKTLDELKTRLDETENFPGGRFLVIDGVFSMTGEVAPLDEITKLIKGRQVRLMVDDAHSLGVLGNLGRGTSDHFGVNENVDIIMGTFSKSFSSIGGFVAGNADVIDFIRHKSRSFIFSAAIPPAAAATVLKCLEIMQAEPLIIKRLWSNTKIMRDGLLKLGVDNLGSTTPINPILVKDDLLSFKIAAELFEMGVYVTPIISPAVPKGKALIRTAVMASHTEEEIHKVLSAFEVIVKKYKIDFKHQKTVENSESRQQMYV